MAVKTFTTGEVLTSTDTNTYLTNAGLVYIKSQPVGTGVATVAVTGAFSAEWDSYKITYSGASSLATGECVRIQMSGATTQYYGSLIYASNAGVVGAVGDNNIAFWSHCGGANQNQVVVDADIHNPYLAKITTIATTIYADNANTGKKQGWLNTTTSYTGFTFNISGTITGGTITVYGYRKA